MDVIILLFGAQKEETPEMRDLFQNWVRRVKMNSPFGVPLTYHMMLSLQTKSGMPHVLFNAQH